MYTFLTKYGQLVSLGIGVLIIVAFYLTALGSLPEGFDTLPKPDQFATNAFNIGLSGAIGLLAVAAAAWLLFSIYQVAKNPKGSLKSIIGFGALLALFFVLYAMADGDVSSPLYEKFGITPTQSKLISAGLSTTYIALGAALLAFVFSEVRNFFK